MWDEKYIGMEMDKTNNTIKRFFARSPVRSSAFDATEKHSRIIGFLARNSGRDMYQRDIEEEFMIRRSTASTILALMEKNGYIVREPVDFDARLKRIVLTPKAIQMNRELMETVISNEKEMRKNISDEEMKVFFSVLRRIRENVEIKEQINNPEEEYK